MTTMTRKHRQARTARKPRLFLNFDNLETRFALSAGGTLDPNPDPPASEVLPFENSRPLGEFLSVVNTSPSPNSTVGLVPEYLSATFDRPIDESSVFYDLRLATRNDQGEWVPFGEEGYPLDLTLDASGRTLTASFGNLPDGQYHLILSGESMLTGADGSSLEPGGTDRVLSAFTVRTRGVKLSDAIDLGRIQGSLTVAGSLDFSQLPADVQLYKVELRSGHFNAFGSEITAQRDGSPVRVGITIFDFAGNRIDSATTGRRDAPADPNLLRGLPDGVYYIGVSDKANMPGLEGAYDPITGSGGVATPGHAGGPFTLTVSATPADEAVKVLAVRVDHADLNSSAATGFSIQFARSLNPTSLQARTTPLLTLVDSAGKSWPIQSTGYDEANAVLSFIFTSTPHVGKYSIVVPEGGITDLADHLPTGASGTSDDLGTINVEETKSNGGPDDFGVMFPGDASLGITRKLAVSQSGPSENHFYVPAGGLFSFDFTYRGGRPQAVIIDAKGHERTIDLNDSDVSGKTLLHLDPGGYTLRLSPEAGRGSIVSATIRQLSVEDDSLLDNGVGQGSALSLSAIAPTIMPTTYIFIPSNPGTSSAGFPVSSDVGPTSITLSSAGTGTINPGQGESLVGGSPVSAMSPSVTSPSLYFAGNNVPVGPLASMNAGIAAVGPGGNGAGESLAANLPNSSIGPGSQLGGVRRFVEKRTKTRTVEHDKNNGSDPTDGSLSAAELDGALISEAIAGDSAQLQRDGAVAAKTLDLPRKLAVPGNPVATQRPGNVTEDETALAANDSDLPPKAGDREGVPTDRSYAEISSSLGVGLLAVAAAHYQRRLGRLLDRIKNHLRPGLRVDAADPITSSPHRPRRF